jgi:manganese/zinc/iron transport system permease protein
MTSWLQIFTEYSLQVVALGSATVGLASGALGSFAVLRRQSLLGDAISHASLPGIALAFLLTLTKAPLILMLGAGVAGWLATMVAMAMVRTTRVKEDGALAMVLSVFFGFGLVVLTYIQRLPQASQAGLDRYLFGQASTLLARDVQAMGILSVAALASLVLLWKEFKIITFDREFAATMGIAVRLVDVLLVTLLVLAIVIGLQTVGVVLMSAMLVAPAAAARQWTDRLWLMVLLSAFFGVVAGTSGAVLSSLTEGLPTGPTIVICVTVLALTSLLLAPHRGLVWSWRRRRAVQHEFPAETVLADLQALAREHQGDHAHSVEVLYALHGNRKRVDRALRSLASRGLAKNAGGNAWTLTPRGAAEPAADRPLHDDAKGEKR